MWKSVRFLVSFYQGAVKTFVSNTAPLPVVDAAASAATVAEGNETQAAITNLNTDLGQQEDAAATTDTGTFSLIALFKRLLSRLPDGQSELTARMKAFHPQAGWRIWLDTANASHIYVLEALASKVAGDTGFQGTRVPKDADGNPLGKVQVNTSATLTFNNRTTDGGWS